MKRLIPTAALLLCACATTPHTVVFPSKDDVTQAVEAKPRPTADILTDPAANDRYNSAIEKWGDDVWSAGARLCRYFKAQGMAVDCPAEGK